MSDRVVLVTGARSGIGRATAEAFAARGWRVFGASRTACTHAKIAMLEVDVRNDGGLRRASRRSSDVRGASTRS
jgi:NAD(P)-dependent dehydrogenase (short-subunit alcohol dehydrogenase family)